MDVKQYHAIVPINVVSALKPLCEKILCALIVGSTAWASCRLLHYRQLLKMQHKSPVNLLPLLTRAQPLYSHPYKIILNKI